MSSNLPPWNFTSTKEHDVGNDIVIVRLGCQFEIFRGCISSPLLSIIILVKLPFRSQFVWRKVARGCFWYYHSFAAFSKLAPDFNMSRIFSFFKRKGTQSRLRNDFTICFQLFGSHWSSHISSKDQITPQHKIILRILYRAVKKHYPLIPREFTNMTDIRGLSFYDSLWYVTINHIYVNGIIWTNKVFQFKTVIP